MNNIEITDTLLYDLVPKVEKILLNDSPPNEDLNHKFSRSFERKMEKLIRKNNYKPFAKGFKKVAVIFLLVTSILFATIMNVEALKTRFIKIIKEVYNELTSFSFIVENDNRDNLDIRFKIMEPEYIPTGFKKIEVDELYTIRIISYENEKGDVIIYQQNYITNGKIILDTEDANIENVKINNYQGQIISKNETNQLIWFSEEYYFNILSTLEKEELIKIGESIK